ncbi:MAG: ABC transporter ATP-binding protein [Acidimicrobiales bacterium]
MSSGPLIEIRGLGLRFDAMRVLQDVSLELGAGEILGLVGPNGAGKTSLLNCLNGAYRPSEGEIHVLGQLGNSLRAHQITKLGVARTFQGGSVLPEMRVLRYVMLGQHLNSRQGVLASAMALPFLSGEERRIRAVAMEALGFLNLEGVADRRLSELPYGFGKLVDIARALASKPRVLLLDEPASGLGDGLRRQLAGLLRRIKEDLDIAQVVVEHDMGLVQSACDRVVVLDAGQVLAVGEPGYVIGLPGVRDAFLGKSLDDPIEKREVASS